MVELVVNGQKLDLPENVRIKKTFQVHDIADVSTVNASYTSSFKIPKSPNNTRILEGLGLVGDNSSVPYTKTTVSLYENGFPLVLSGWLDVKSTDIDTYNISIRDGIIDFFKEIGNKTIGGNVDISELEHQKTIQVVKDSLDNEFYRYLVNDYGGQSVASPPTDALNIDYLVPSARLKYIWEQIFKAFNYTFSGEIFSDENFENAWITYPKSNAEITSVDLIDYRKETLGEEVKWVLGNDGRYYLRGKNVNLNWTSVTIHDSYGLGTEIDPYQLPKIKINSTGYYSLTIEFDALVGYIYRRNPGPLIHTITFEAPFKFEVYLNDVFVGSVMSNSTEVVIPFPANPLDKIKFRMVALNKSELWEWAEENDSQWEDGMPPIDAYEFLFLVGMEWNDLNVEIKAIEFEGISFENAFKDFSITDFFKEVMNRFALTPIIDTHSRHITFYKISELLVRSNYIDWTSKYVSRKSEVYEFGSYAQKNNFTHKYSQEDKTYSDESLNVFNQNLNESKTIVSSKFFSPEEEPTFIDFHEDGATVFPTLIWTAETKTDDENNITVTYKGQSGRWFWLKSKRENRNITFVSPSLGEDSTDTAFNLADTSFTTFKDIIPTYYDGYEQLLNNSRIHTIELSLGVADVVSLDYTKLYYFAQEQSFYKLNKINYENGKISTGEFIKINQIDGE